MKRATAGALAVVIACLAMFASPSSAIAQTSVLTNTQTLIAGSGGRGDNFGSKIAVDGDWMVVGAPNDSLGTNVNQGSIYVFHRTGSTWAQAQRFVISNGAGGDKFGFSVAIRGDVIAAGAPGRDKTGETGGPDSG